MAGALSRSATLLVCDVQTRFRPLIYRMETVIAKCAFLNDLCNLMAVPVVVTEQYPKALGPTVPEIALKKPPYSKMSFSMCTAEVINELQEHRNENIIICGIESHVCVLQTVLALHVHDRRLKIYVVCDAISSRRPQDRAVALQRMSRIDNVYLTTAESVAFELLQTAENPKFKEASAMIKALHDETSPDEFKDDSNF